MDTGDDGPGGKKSHGNMKLGDLLEGEYLTDILVILSHVTGKGKAWILSHLDAELPRDLFLKAKDLISQRKSGIPLAYLTKRKEFMGIEFHIESGVFIPRSETETLVELAIKLIREKGFEVVADVGSGSGSIAVSIAKYSGVKVLATDISPKAVELTIHNARMHKVNHLIEARHGEFLEPFKERLKEIQLVISNPPYVEPEYELPIELRHEPREAFFYGESSVSFYKEFSKRYRGMNFTVAMEFSGKDKDKKIIGQLFKDVVFIKDLDKVERFFIGCV